MFEKNNVKKLVVLSILSAIGVILMAFVEIPYPFAPFLKIEFSDFVVLVAFMLFGWKEAIIVALIKTLGDLAFQGPVGAFSVGQITAFLSSCSYVFGLMIALRLFPRERKGSMLFVAIFTAMFVAAVMTTANYFFLTPWYLNATSVFDLGDWSGLNKYEVNSYGLAILLLYVPFNFIKATCIFLVYGTIGSQIIRYYQSRLEGE